MYLVNSGTEYALRALLYMVGRDTIISAQELAEALNIPRPFLRRILQELKQRKIIKAQRGQKGGFMLAINPDEISVFSILAIFQGDFYVAKCGGETALCTQLGCLLRPHLRSLEKEFQEKLQALTLSILAKREGEGYVAGTRANSN